MFLSNPKNEKLNTGRTSLRRTVASKNNSLMLTYTLAVSPNH